MMMNRDSDQESGYPAGYFRFNTGIAGKKMSYHKMKDGYKMRNGTHQGPIGFWGIPGTYHNMEY